MDIAVQGVGSAVTGDIEFGRGASGQFLHVVVVIEHLKMKSIGFANHTTLPDAILAPDFCSSPDCRVQSIHEMHVQGVIHDITVFTDIGLMLQQHIPVIGSAIIIQRESIAFVCGRRRSKRNNFPIRNRAEKVNAVVAFLAAVGVENMHTTVPLSVPIEREIPVYIHGHHSVDP